MKGETGEEYEQERAEVLQVCSLLRPMAGTEGDAETAGTAGLR